MYTLTYKVYCEFIPFGKYLNLKETNWFLEDFSQKENMKFNCTLHLPQQS